MRGARMRSRAHRAGEAAAAIQLANDRPAFGEEAPATRKLIVAVYDFRIDAERLREPSDPALQQRAEQNSGAEDPQVRRLRIQPRIGEPLFAIGGLLAHRPPYGGVLAPLPFRIDVAPRGGRDDERRHRRRRDERRTDLARAPEPVPRGVRVDAVAVPQSSDPRGKLAAEHPRTRIRMHKRIPRPAGERSVDTPAPVRVRFQLQRERQIRARALERGERSGEVVGEPEIVMVEKRDVATASEFDPRIRRTRLIADTRIEVHVPDARVCERRDDFPGVVGATVTDHEQFPIGPRLRDDRTDHVADDVAAVERGDDDRHGRNRGRGLDARDRRCRNRCRHGGAILRPSPSSPAGFSRMATEATIEGRTIRYSLTKLPAPKMCSRRLALAGLAVAALLATGVSVPGIADEPVRVLLVVGDSISAGYGLPAGTGWVDLLASRIGRERYPLQVVNASITGDTTAGGRTRLPALITRYKPAIVVVELGGNDGLRGGNLAATRENLDAMVADVQRAGAKAVIVGMKLPPNYGPAYTREFETLYATVAKAHNAPLVPYLFEGFGERNELFQPDRIHPTAAAQTKILDNVWPALKPLLPAPR